MTLIFGIVFFILAKWGFPMITDSVQKRADRINASIKAAKEAEEKLRNLAAEQSEMIEEARKEQARILKEAAASRDMIVEQAKVQAQDEATKIMDHARTQIAADKESALRDIRKEVALLSVSVAEKVLKKDLEDSGSQTELVNRLVDEIGKKSILVLGNSSGELAMAQYTVQNNGKAFLLLCDDMERDYGILDVAKSFAEECEALSFETISIKDDFVKIYGDHVIKVEDIQLEEAA